MAFVEPAVAVGQDEFEASPVAMAALGTRAVTRDGRVFRYAQAGALALVPGTLVQSMPPVFEHQGIAVTVAAGVREFLMPAVTVGGAANLYTDGYLMGALAPTGAGSVHTITGHAVISTTVPWKIKLADPLVVANPSGVDLVAHPYRGVIITPGAPTSRVVGVPIIVIPAGHYGWLLTWGVTPVLFGGNGANGQRVVTNGAAGSVIAQGAALSPFEQSIGVDVGYGSAPKKTAVFVDLGA